MCCRYTSCNSKQKQGSNCLLSIRKKCLFIVPGNIIDFWSTFLNLAIAEELIYVTLYLSFHGQWGKHFSTLLVITKDQQMRARISFLPIWGLKDLETCRKVSMSIPPSPPPPRFWLFFLHSDSNNWVIWWNLWNSNTRAFHETLIPLFASLRFSNLL